MFREQNGIQWRIDDVADGNAGAPTIGVVDLIFIFWRGQPYVFVHVDNRHHFARVIGGICSGAMKGPAGVETDVAKAEVFSSVRKL